MSLNSIYAGGRVVADDVRNVAPLSAYKGSDESLASSVALQNDDSLFLPLSADTTYHFEATVVYEGGTQGASDIQWKWTGPTGFTMRYHHINVTTSGASSVGFLSNESSNPNAGTSGAGNLQAITMTGTVTISDTPGNLQLQWAQKTSSATPTIVHAGSDLVAWAI